MVSISTSPRGIANAVGVLLLIGIVAPFVVVAAPQVAGASQSYVVLSSSMSPGIHAGDVVIDDAANPQAIQKGDVITFNPPSGEYSGAKRVTHRVVDVVHKNGGTYFKTKGDANDQPDPNLVPASNVVGVVAFNIPKIGYVVNFAGTQFGLLLLVIVPAVLLAVSEVYDLLTGEEPTDENP